LLTVHSHYPLSVHSLTNIIIPVEKLRRYFKQYGAVQDAAVMKDPISKRSRGFGFITFTDLSSVDHALAHDPHTIDSRKVGEDAQLMLVVCDDDDDDECPVT